MAGVVAGLSIGLAVQCLSTATIFADENPSAAAPSNAQAQPASSPDVGALLANPKLEKVQRLQLEVLQLINQRRAEAGLGPLLLDQRLVAAATEHSQDMAAHRYCRHAGNDHSTARKRMARQNYPFNNWAGENIICSRRTADAAMKWWMHSTPHRKNILHKHFTHIGIGIDLNGPYGPMWTLDFAAGASDTVHPTAFDVNDTSGEAGDPPAAAQGDAGGG
jgi:uncharacterized protein YkwD